MRGRRRSRVNYGVASGEGLTLGVEVGAAELADEAADELPVVTHSGAGEPLAPPLSKYASGR